MISGNVLRVCAALSLTLAALSGCAEIDEAEMVDDEQEGAVSSIAQAIQNGAEAENAAWSHGFGRLWGLFPGESQLRPFCSVQAFHELYAMTAKHCLDGSEAPIPTQVHIDIGGVFREIKSWAPMVYNYDQTLLQLKSAWRPGFRREIQRFNGAQHVGTQVICIGRGKMTPDLKTRIFNGPHTAAVFTVTGSFNEKPIPTRSEIGFAVRMPPIGDTTSPRIVNGDSGVMVAHGAVSSYSTPL
jgi:hypothetical protein